MRKINFIFLVLILTSCCTFGPSRPVPEYISKADAIRSSVSERLARKYNMCIVGTIDGMMYNVNKLGVMFHIYRPLTLEEAREIYVDCVLEFLNEINNNEEIRPYLVNYPFTLQNVDISIASRTSIYTDYYDPFIYYVMNIKDKVYYVTKPPENKFDRKEHIETFDEALSIVQANFQHILQPDY